MRLFRPMASMLLMPTQQGYILRQISTGETHPWAVPKGFVAWPESWFPDSAHLLVLHMAGQPESLTFRNLASGSFPSSAVIRKRLKDDAVGAYVSPDGSRVMYLPGPAFGTELVGDGLRWSQPSKSNLGRRTGSAELDGKRNPPDGLVAGRATPGIHRKTFCSTHLIPRGRLFRSRLSMQTGVARRSFSDDPRIGRALWWAADGRILYSYREDRGRRNQTIMGSTRSESTNAPETQSANRNRSRMRRVASVV